MHSTWGVDFSAGKSATSLSTDEVGVAEGVASGGGGWRSRGVGGEGGGVGWGVERRGVAEPLSVKVSE